MGHKLPIVWTIAGSDSGGSAGIQADLKVFNVLGVHGCSAITATTAQNTQAVWDVFPLPEHHLLQQLQALKADLPPVALKLGMLGETVLPIIEILSTLNAVVIYDPVMVSTSGNLLMQQGVLETIKAALFPLVDLLTPNWPEAEAITNTTITKMSDVPRVAKQLLTMGVKAVLIKGGHSSDNTYALDYYQDVHGQQFWLSSPWVETQNTHGTGCTLSAAITAYVALGFALPDAIVKAKALLQQGLRETTLRNNAVGLGQAGMTFIAPSTMLTDWPMASIGENLPDSENTPFLPTDDIGFYPVVPTTVWVEKLAKWGVKNIQLRFKHDDIALVEDEVKRAIAVGQQYNAQVWINDHWDLAIKHKAYGVHLGQSDLLTADIHALVNAGLRLGVSTHTPFEVARALALQPSYIAIGPVFATTTKVMPYLPQGVEALNEWVALLSPVYKTVAIGGIFYHQHAEQIKNTGVNGIAVVRDVTESPAPEEICKAWLALFKAATQKQLLSV